MMEPLRLPIPALSRSYPMTGTVKVFWQPH